MPYTLTLDAISRVEAFLEAMLQAKTDISFASEEPSKLAYWLHNGIAASEHFPDFEKYADLATKFRIKVRKQAVTCELRSFIAARIGSRVSFESEGTNLAMPITLPDVRNNEVDSATGIITVLTTAKTFKTYFTNAYLTEEELGILYNWTSQNGYHIINHEDEGVTVTREETELEWKPSL